MRFILTSSPFVNTSIYGQIVNVLCVIVTHNCILFEQGFMISIWVLLYDILSLATYMYTVDDLEVKQRSQS